MRVGQLRQIRQAKIENRQAAGDVMNKKRTNQDKHSSDYRKRHWRYVARCERVLRRWDNYFLDDLELSAQARDDAMYRYASESVIVLESALRLLMGKKTVAYQTALKWKKDEEMQVWLTTEPPPRELLLPRQPRPKLRVVPLSMQPPEPLPPPPEGINISIKGKYDERVVSAVRAILESANQYDEQNRSPPANDYSDAVAIRKRNILARADRHDRSEP